MNYIFCRKIWKKGMFKVTANILEQLINIPFKQMYAEKQEQHRA